MISDAAAIMIHVIGLERMSSMINLTLQIYSTDQTFHDHQVEYKE